ncbi:MAG: DHHA1 domain-containing protein, partial [Pseudomonadota bacterium]
PDVLITVDNGISSIEGVDAANQRGIKVLITDHHLPGPQLPTAHAIVNPNLDGEEFPSRALAGVGVMFYVLMALRSRLRDAGWFARAGVPEPNLGQLLDLVALGTIADVVPLDHVNRILVHQGLQRIRSGKAQPGILALIEVAGRNAKALTASDLGFAVGPRLNAAGRLEDMTLGIEALLTQDMEEARSMAARLNELNTERREIEEQMKLEAVRLIKGMKVLDEAHLPVGVCLYDDGWHQGVVGILASRIKDRLHRPVIAFAPAGNGEIKGSGRSIPGVHIRDVLSNVATGHPGLLKKFGGHAMAAGLSLHISDYPAFSLAFDRAVRDNLNGIDLAQTVYTDGRLEGSEMALEFAELLQGAGPWGQGFPEPAFDGEFEVIQARIVGQKHLKMVLRLPESPRMVDAIAFFVDDPESWLGTPKVRLVYRLDVNEYRDTRSLQLVVEYMEHVNPQKLPVEPWVEK